LVIRKSAPSKNERREKVAAGWDRKALIKNRGKRKTKTKTMAEDLRHATE
jgi:hypothetical protein